ncbi:MAG: hypothetical protein OEZ20_02280 [candidate division WOR-3 bacterium]|nr:hypothetical protein [candidate division WOR-3 bacterium]
MKILITYYSRTGVNESVCKSLQSKLDCDIEPIIDTKNRKGLWGLLICGFDATFKKMSKIGAIEKDPGNYDLVIVSTPIWAGTITPAIRTYVFENKDKFKKVAFVSVSGSGEENKKVLPDFESLANKKVITSLLLRRWAVRKGTHQEKVESFVKEILSQDKEIK